MRKSTVKTTINKPKTTQNTGKLTSRFSGMAMFGEGRAVFDWSPTSFSVQSSVKLTSVFCGEGRSRWGRSVWHWIGSDDVVHLAKVVRTGAGMVHLPDSSIIDRIHFQEIC
jgi:hypothetical protein